MSGTSLQNSVSGCILGIDPGLTGTLAFYFPAQDAIGAEDAPVAGGVIAASGVPLHLVSPAKWKRHFGLDADKENSRALAPLADACRSFRPQKGSRAR